MDRLLARLTRLESLLESDEARRLQQRKALASGGGADALSVAREKVRRGEVPDLAGLVSRGEREAALDLLYRFSQGVTIDRLRQTYWAGVDQLAPPIKAWLRKGLVGLRGNRLEAWLDRHGFVGDPNNACWRQAHPEPNQMWVWVEGGPEEFVDPAADSADWLVRSVPGADQSEARRDLVRWAEVLTPLRARLSVSLDGGRVGLELTARGRPPGPSFHAFRFTTPKSLTELMATPG